MRFLHFSMAWGNVLEWHICNFLISIRFYRFFMDDAVLDWILNNISNTPIYFLYLNYLLLENTSSTINRVFVFLDPEPCPAGFKKFMKSCYMFNNTPSSYEEALRECRKVRGGESGDLASLHNAHEQGEYDTKYKKCYRKWSFSWNTSL